MPFYGPIIIYIFFNKIHIRTISCHRNIDHFDTEVLGDHKVFCQVSRNRAEEFTLSSLHKTSASRKHHMSRHGLPLSNINVILAFRYITIFFSPELIATPSALLLSWNTGQDSIVSYIAVERDIVTGAGFGTSIIGRERRAALTGWPCHAIFRALNFSLDTFVHSPKLLL